MVLKVSITYYGGRFRALEQMLLAKYKEKIIVEEIPTLTDTELFEVQIEGGKLAWSKKATNRHPTSRFEAIFN